MVGHGLPRLSAARCKPSADWPQLRVVLLLLAQFVKVPDLGEALQERAVLPVQVDCGGPGPVIGGLASRVALLLDSCNPGLSLGPRRPAPYWVLDRRRGWSRKAFLVHFSGAPALPAWHSGDGISIDVFPTRSMLDLEVVAPQPL